MAGSLLKFLKIICKKSLILSKGCNIWESADSCSINAPACGKLESLFIGKGQSSPAGGQDSEKNSSR
jgi:hypothetical protein